MNANSMSRWVIVIFLLMHSSIVFGQKIFIILDSSRLIFPNHVSIDFERQTRRGLSYYALPPAAMKTLFVQCNYMYGTLDLTLQRSRLLEQEALVKDSIIHSLNQQLDFTGQRLSVFRSGYENLKNVNEDYDKQLATLISELEMVRKKNRRQKRILFSKGLVVGLGSGIVLTSFLLLNRN